MNTKEQALDLIATVTKRQHAFYERWGKDRFLKLLDPEYKHRFLQMQNKYMSVEKSNKYLSVVTMAEGMLRAYDKCEENIINRGHEELNSDIWDVTYNGKQYLIVKDKRYYKRATDMAAKDNSTHIVWHIEELFKLLPSDSFKLVDALKTEFVGAELINGR